MIIHSSSHPPLEESQTKEAYISGQCNIGPAEISRRMRMGYSGLAMMIVFIVIAEAVPLPQVWKFALFVPSAFALSGFLQARQRFCFLFGFFGIFSITGKRSKIENVDHLRKDRSKGFRLVSQIFLGSCILTLLYYFLS